MIVPMKKAAIIAETKNAEAVVKKLRLLGVLHIEHIRRPAGRQISDAADNIAAIEEALGILSGFAPGNGRAPLFAEKQDGFEKISRHIIDFYKRLDQLQEYSRRVRNLLDEYAPWGDFDSEKISFLAEKNIFVRLYRIPQGRIKDFPKEAVVKTVSVSKGTANIVVISRQKIDFPFKELVLPKIGPKQMRRRLTEDAFTIKSIRDDIAGCVCFKNFLLEAKKSLEQRMRFYEAVEGVGVSGDISYLTGYIPCDAAQVLSDAAKKEKWGIVIDEPSAQDNVPTLLRNPKWVSFISPVFRVLAVVPGYRELDVSLWFLVFFSVFFGILIGDAGQGLLFLGLTAFAHYKFGRKTADKSVFALFYILSLCAILWGVLSATFFGREWLPLWVTPLLPELRDNNTVQTICFFLGAFHLSIAHLWRAILKAPSAAALSEIGWINIIWASFYIARTLILGDVLPDFVRYFLIAGPLLVIFFSSANKNVLKALGGGLGNFLLNAINCFTDVVSYIRLFAVGLATVAVADSFNKMAAGAGFDGIFAGITAVIILLLGHLLNAFLGPMSVLVHGVRLNVLEFCGHAGVKWSGFDYRPLREE